MRSAMCCTTPRSWDTMMIAISGSALRMASKDSRIRTLAATSMALIGSSASNTFGPSTMARAIAARCACPPDRSTGKRLANVPGSRLTISSTSATRSATRSRGQSG